MLFRVGCKVGMMGHTKYGGTFIMCVQHFSLANSREVNDLMLKPDRYRGEDDGVEKMENPRNPPFSPYKPKK